MSDMTDEQLGLGEYTLTTEDVAVARQTLETLCGDAMDVGGYTFVVSQAWRRSASVTIRYDKQPGPTRVARAAEHLGEAGPLLASLCRRIVAHAQTHPDQIA